MKEVISRLRSRMLLRRGGNEGESGQPSALAVNAHQWSAVRQRDLLHIVLDTDVGSTTRED